MPLFEFFLEAKAEILKKYGWFFGYRFEDTKKSFQNQLTFMYSMQYGQSLHEVAINFFTHLKFKGFISRFEK